MPNLTSVGITAGVPTSGTGTVSTIDNLIGTAGTAAAQVLSVQGIASGTNLPVSGTVTVNALPTGTNTIGSIKVTDGTNVSAVKAASTAPLTTDPAAVVSISPNSAGIVALGGASPANSVPTVVAGYLFSHISTATTTTVKSGAGALHTLTVNSLGTVASTTTLYDNTAASGAVIAVLNTLTVGQATYTYDLAFTNGLTVVTTGTVAPDITISYR